MNPLVYYTAAFLSSPHNVLLCGHPAFRLEFVRSTFVGRPSLLQPCR